MSVQRGYRGLWLIKAQKESSYAATGPAMTHWIRTIGDDPDPRPSVEVQDDAGEQTGSEFPIHQEMLERSFAFGRNFNVCTETLGLFGAFAAGRDTVSTPGSTDKLHSITLAPDDERLGSFACEYHANGVTPDSDTDWEFRGCNVNEFELSASRRGLVRGRVAIIGSHTAAASETPTLASLRTNGPRFASNKVLLSIAECTTEHESVWDGTFGRQSGAGNVGRPVYLETPLLGVDSWRFRFANNHDEESRFGAGTSASQTIVGIEPEIDRRSISLEVTLRHDDAGRDLIKKLWDKSSTNNSEFAVMISGVGDGLLTDGPHQFGIILPICGIQQVPQSNSGLGIRSSTFSFMAKKDQSADNFDPFYLFVMNSYASAYNQAPA